MNDLLVAAILGLVEGITEFLPISSTGHLILAGHLLGWTGEKAEAFEMIIQSGAMLAVLLHYRARFAGLLFRPAAEGFAGARGLGLLALATFPALATAFLLRKIIKAHLFNPAGVAVALLAGGIAILFVERTKRTERIVSLDAIDARLALGVGLFQCLALWPGVSRSAATILGGMLLGLGRKTAAEFSFFAAVPILLAAGAYELAKHGASLTPDDLGVFAVGLLVAFVSALGAIRFFLALVATRTLAPFGWYRIALAGAVLFLLD